MPLTKSAKKALRVDRRRKAINDLTRAKMKSALKAARLAVAAGDKDSIKKINAAYRQLDIAAKKNVIHKNRAARLKSRLAKKLARTADRPKAPTTKSKSVGVPSASVEKRKPTKKTFRKKTSV